MALQIGPSDRLPGSPSRQSHLLHRMWLPFSRGLFPVQPRRRGRFPRHWRPLLGERRSAHHLNLDRTAWRPLAGLVGGIFTLVWPQERHLHSAVSCWIHTQTRTRLFGQSVAVDDPQSCMTTSATPSGTRRVRWPAVLPMHSVSTGRQTGATSQQSSRPAISFPTRPCQASSTATSQSWLARKTGSLVTSISSTL